jgi:hypothetical protein
MVRLRFSFTALALMGLMAPTSARADNGLGWPAQPVSSSASPAGSTAEQSSYEEYEPDAPLAASAQSVSTGLASTATTSSSCTTSSCMSDCCRNLGDCRGRCWQSFVGVEASLLAPVMNHGGGGASYHYAEGANTRDSSRTGSVNGMIVTPRIWAGVMGEYWGFGVRYWRFANTQGGIETSNGGTFPAGANQGLFNQGYLRLQTVDLEVIRRLYVNESQVWLSGGVRYGQLTRNSIVSGANNDGPANTTVQGSAWTGTGFNGVGPTVALYGWRALGDSGSWNLFYGGRASYLWDNNSSSISGASAGASVAPSESQVNSVRVNNANAFVSELNLGAQYNHYLKTIPAIAFFRLGLEYQYWHLNNGGGSIAQAGATATGGAIPSVFTQAFSQNSTIGLLGLSASTGFTW